MRLTQELSLRMTPKQRYRIPCVLMRGGTSRGPFFLSNHLPLDTNKRDRILLNIMGSPQFRRVDGIAGMDPVTSKLAIIARSERQDADVDYLFGQADSKMSSIDFSANCGNLLSAVAPFAIEEGLVRVGDPMTCVRIYNINTGVIVHALVPTPRGRVEYEGSFAIDGVPGTGSAISLEFLNSVGAKTGKLLPTGNAIDCIDGIDVSCVDVSVPVVIVAASSLGKTGEEQPEELNSDLAFLTRLEQIRLLASQKMGMKNCVGAILPKVCLVSRADSKGNLRGRYFTPTRCHPSFAVTGALCVGVASKLPGTVAYQLRREVEGQPAASFILQHPTGRIEAEIVVSQKEGHFELQKAAFLRTAARLFEGYAFVSGSEEDQ